jgi:hypothetical protein
VLIRLGTSYPRYDFLGWARNNFGTNKKNVDVKAGRSVERTNGTIGYGTHFSVPPEEYVDFIKRFIESAYYYNERIPLDETPTPVFRM